MKKLIVAAVFAASSCAGGQAPELYSVVVDFFRPAATCYAGGQYPTTNVTASSPVSLRVEVYDWQDQKVFMEITDGAVNIDMGDAPSVALGGLFEGSKPTSADQPINFAANRTVERTTGGLGGSVTVTDVTSATVAFNRGQTFKGTLALNSSETCTGSGCPTTQSCAISAIQIRGTRLQVDYQQQP
jgi:hypothetical protein